MGRGTLFKTTEGADAVRNFVSSQYILPRVDLRKFVLNGNPPETVIKEGNAKPGVL